jgi:hypothetical protein
MPGMSGTELAGLLRVERPSIKVLIVSRYAEVDGIVPDPADLAGPAANASAATRRAWLDSPPTFARTTRLCATRQNSRSGTSPSCGAVSMGFGCRMQEWTGRAVSAAAMVEKAAVHLRSFRLQSRRILSSLRARMRQPSCFSSWIQPCPAGTTADDTGWQGSM